MFREIKLFFFLGTRYMYSKEKADDVFSISLLSHYLTSDAYADTLSCHFPGLLSKIWGMYYHKW